MIRRPPRSTQSRSSAASDVYKRQRIVPDQGEGVTHVDVMRVREHALGLLDQYPAVEGVLQLSAHHVALPDGTFLQDADGRDVRERLHGLRAVSYTHLRAHE